MSEEFGGGHGGGDAETLVAGGEPGAVRVTVATDKRKLVGSGGAEASPGADDAHVENVGEILCGAGEHLRDHVRLDRAVIGSELAGTANEELAGFARLDVEGDTFCGIPMGTL